jgi:hypothetical protein
VMPLVFTPSPLHTYILGPPRQAALTLVFLAVWLVDRSDAGASLRSKARMAAAGVTASLACFADPYALLFLPPFFLLALVLALPPCAMETSRWATTFRTVRPTLAGAVVGIVPLLLLLASPRSVHGEATFTPSVIGHNAKLLYDECLPWVMSSTAFVPGDAGYAAWNPGAFRAIQLAGPFLVFSAVAFALSSPPRPVSEAGGERHFWALGLYGVAVLALDVAAFLASPMVMDVFSARYLAAIVLMMPFALAPAASRLKPAVFTALMAPYLVSAGVCGWVGFGGQVRGLSPVRLPGGGALDEERLQALLRDHSVGHAVADYWVSYRLTFLYRETIEVVPIHPEEDRYAPYRRAFDQSSNVAYVFDARRSREQLGPMLEDLETKYGAPEETLVSGDLKAFVFERAVTP